MDIQIKEVTTKKELKAFIKFPYQLYKGNSCFVPPLQFDEYATLSKEKNPAFEYCEARYWLALKNKKVVGRIAGIINHASIRKWEKNYIRFGWLDFEEDKKIASALLTEVENWGKARNLDAIQGPMGFTDMDRAGMLIEGFDQLGMLATIYNYPYYPAYLQDLGYKKEVDWLEFRIKVPGEVPDKIRQMAKIVTERLGLSVVKVNKAKEIRPYATEVFQLINQAYANLHGVVELTEKQIKYYTNQYFSFIRPDYVTIVKDREGKLAAFGITMPSLSRALQKANGKLFPLGFLYLLLALKKNTLADLYLVAVRPDLQNKGVNAIIMNEINLSYIKNGVHFAEASPELETNHQIQALWKYYETESHKRRRCFIKLLL
ncbi:N-acetyltransferase [Flavihumibacter profundi]|uniref:N-acetyltransferase n=1 Tax=Flavihumibacter profundi TaxID=2716883 RepID=UPI001CC4B753|nr:N-acetyltransferase [Flavihumibacter profundi]MBZ5859355.1 N-acetyltransferase [Flavihumibacter profundi]